MSEKHPHSPEHQAEKLLEIEQQPRIEAHSHNESHESEPSLERPQVEQIRSQIEQQAAPAEDLKPAEKHETSDRDHHPLMLNKHLKDTAYDRTMVRVQKKLALPDRALSKLIHSPLIDKPAEVAGKTIARPSGMLGGALFSLIGTSLVLWLARKYGYEYNYLIALLTFAAGIVLGLLVEGIYRLLRQK